jgi:hypothetical protein
VTSKSIKNKTDYTLDLKLTLVVALFFKNNYKEALKPCRISIIVIIGILKDRVCMGDSKPD